jgi:hypothetical protein
MQIAVGAAEGLQWAHQSHLLTPCLPAPPIEEQNLPGSA